MSRRKGYHHENEIRKLLVSHGIPCRRIPMSGALKNTGPDLNGDLVILDTYRVEVKYRTNGKGFVTLEGWMQDCNILFLKRERQKPMVMMDWDTFTEMMEAVCNAPHDKKTPTD